MSTALTRLSGSAFELTITVPWADVKKIYDQVFDELSAEIEIEGFRKGKAPKEVIAGKIDKSKVYGEVVNRVLPEAYQKALAEHSLKPVVAPKVQIASGEQDKDWQFIAKAAEKPTVNLGAYKEAIKTINAKGKIWTPESSVKDETKGTSSETKDKEQEERSKKISEIIDKLLEVCKVELAELLVESEVNRLMTQLVDDIRQAGLTFEQYLASKGETTDQVRQKYRQQAETALKLEFILDGIADDLKVEVTKAEIDTIINKETDTAKKRALQEQSYLLASVIRRENTITRLLSL